ncbi:hypothetical protein ALP75_200600 [Pseudomonas syringae pv. actinidiae]|nr:hypothetical protein ALP75_200600 [Pseudomonas syringae pv. actinidiae]
MLDTRQARHSGVIQTSGQTRAVSHLHQMPEQTETGDIGHRRHAGQFAETAARRVQRAHPVTRQADVFFTQFCLLFSSGQNADAQRFGQVQHAAGLRGVVAFHVFFLHHAGDGQAEYRLRRIDGMAARQWDTGSVAHGATATDHFASHFGRQHIDWPAENGDGHQRIAAHRIDVADRIGRGDAAEVERVIDDRHEEVGGRDYAALVVQRVNRCIVTRGITDPEFRVQVLRAAAGKDHVQYPGGNLAATPCSVTVLGQADWLIHRDTLGKRETGCGV